MLNKCILVIIIIIIMIIIIIITIKIIMIIITMVSEGNWSLRETDCAGNVFLRKTFI